MAKKEEKTLNDAYSLQELIAQTLRMINKEITSEDYEKWANKLELKASLPLTEKMKYMMAIISELEYPQVSSKEILVCEIYKYIFFYVYIQGYLGIKRVDKYEMTYENYDLLEPVFGPWIETFAGRDAKLFKEMLNLAFNFYGIDKINDSVEAVDFQKLDESTKATKELVNSLNNNKDMVKDLKDIMIADNPIVKDITKIAAASVKE